MSDGQHATQVNENNPFYLKPLSVEENAVYENICDVLARRPGNSTNAVNIEKALRGDDAPLISSLDKLPVDTNEIMKYRIPRYYHNMRHVISMWREYEDYSTYFESISALETAEFIVFHDAVFVDQTVFGRGFNEYYSSLVYESDRPFVSPRTNVVTGILLTAKHVDYMPYITPLHKVWLDLDLTGFAVDGLMNASLLGKEATFLDGALSRNPLTYLLGRLHFLEAMLSRPRIYYTDYFYAKYEAKARDVISQDRDLCRNYLKNRSEM